MYERLTSEFRRKKWLLLHMNYVLLYEYAYEQNIRATESHS